MYEEFFRLSERPFPSAPRTDFYYPASSAENAHQTLTRCIGRAEGPGMLIGGTGSGKSLLCQLLADRFRDAFHVVMLTSARLCTRRALLQNILFELDLPYRGLEEGELRLSLMDFLQPEKSNRDGMLLLVDEAHTLPLRLVEEIRMITNLVRDGQPRVHLVLVGSQMLEERLASRKLESLNQRIAARCYLQSLNYEETSEYVRSQIAMAGGDPEQVFDEDAFAAIHQATDGVPRLVNQVCDHALVLAVVNEQQPVDARMIEEAWADLQQLPAPSRAASSEAAADETVIEFGALEEPDFAESSKAEPAVPEPTSDPGDIDLTWQLDEIETCVSQVEEDPENAGDLDACDEPTDELPSEEETALSAELPDEPTCDEAEPACDEVEPACDEVEPACDEVEATIQDEEESLEAPQTENPFDESFDDEETVVDHYARLYAEAPSAVNAAPNGHDSELEAAAETIFQGSEQMAPVAEDWPDEPAKPEPTDATDSAAPAEEAFSEVNELIVQADREFDDQVHDTDYAEEQVHDFETGACDVDDIDESVPVQAHVMRVPPPDDSDLIVVVDEEVDSTLVSGDSGETHRQEYRQLFSRLRQT